MSTERAPLAAVPGLSRTAKVPPPPPRRPRPQPTEEERDNVRPAKGEPAQVVAKKPASLASERVVAVTLSLPVSLITQVKAHARGEGITQPELLMDALSATHTQLTDLLTAATSQPTSDGLFVRRGAKPQDAEQFGTLSLRLLSPNLEAIDALKVKHEAPSRSALCATALRAYLAER